MLKSIDFWPLVPKHCRMRSPSSALVMAANQTSAVDVLFDVDHDVIRQKWLFSARQYSKFFEKLQNFF